MEELLSGWGRVFGRKRRLLSCETLPKYKGQKEGKAQMGNCGGGEWKVEGWGESGD